MDLTRQMNGSNDEETGSSIRAEDGAIAIPCLSTAPGTGSGVPDSLPLILVNIRRRRLLPTNTPHNGEPSYIDRQTPMI